VNTTTTTTTMTTTIVPPTNDAGMTTTDDALSITPPSLERDVAHVLLAPPALRDAMVYQFVAEHRFACVDFECAMCAMLDCPRYSPEHVDAKQCPVCVVVVVEHHFT